MAASTHRLGSNFRDTIIKAAALRLSDATSRDTTDYAEIIVGDGVPSGAYGRASGATLVYLRKDATAGSNAVYVSSDGGTSWTPSGGKAYAAAAASTAITGATETSTAFDSSVSLAANVLKAGSVIRFSAWGKVTAATGAETHTLSYQVGSVAIATTGNLDPNANDYFHIMGEVTVRTAGASGTCVGWVRITSGASAASGTPLMYFLDSTTIDTTAANVCAVYLDRQGSATDGDSMRLDHHFVEVI